MVKFSLKLEDNRVDKWSPHYLDYKRLKKAIKQLVCSRAAANYAARRQASFSPYGVTQDAEAYGVTHDSKEETPPRPSEETELLPFKDALRPSEPTGLFRSPDALRPSEATGLLPSTDVREIVPASARATGVPEGVELASFESLVKGEIHKVERFFTKAVEDLRNKLASLDPTVPIRSIISERAEQAEAMVDSHGTDESEPWVMRAKPVLERKAEDSLKRDLLALYRDLTLLQNFAILNYTAVVKITKKYDKQVVGKVEEYWPGISIDPAVAIHNKMVEYVHHQDFYNVVQLKAVIAACEAFYAGVFCGGNVAQARGLMLPQKTDERVDLAQFQLGYRMGMAAVLALWILWDCCFERHEDDYPHWKVSVLLQPAFPVYRAVAGILLLRWCWALSSLVWGRARINYIYLFEMDPRAVSSPLEVFNNVAAETVIYLANLLMYYKLLLHRFPSELPAGYLPLMLCVYVIFQVVVPFRKSWEFWRVVARVLVAPLCKVEFFATYVADVMTSSVKTTQDIAWTFCFFLSGDFLLSLKEYHASGGSWQHSRVYTNLVIPALCILPLWLRFQQCLRRYLDTQKRFPHLANCLKYSMAFTVALFGVFTPPNSTTTTVKILWFILYIVSTLYTFAWDVLQDWGLGHGEFHYLRKKRLFSSPWVYYIAVVVDLVLRFNWLYSLIPPGHNPLPFIHSSTLPVFITTSVIVCEFLRRTMWGFFRVENEHLNNTEGYRSTDKVPLHFTTPTARTNEPRKSNTVVIGEVVGVTAAGVAMAAVAVMAARDQTGASP